MDIPIALDKETLPDDGVVDLRSQQADDEAARKSERDEVASSSELLEPAAVAASLFPFTSTGVISAASFVKERQVMKKTVTKSEVIIVEERADGHSHETTRKEGMYMSISVILRSR
jgi:hypothetical protein